MAKSKAHIRYKNKDGIIVPGVTTITGVLNKPALVKWANNLGLQGIDSSKYRDDKADIGTLAHALCTNYLLKKETDTLDYTKNQIDAAENSFLSFLEYLKENKIEPVLIEEPLVSEADQYGGTIDIYGWVNGWFELWDLKTGNGIYTEMHYQVAAYEKLLMENGHPVGRVRIINIPRSEDEAFKEEIVTDLEKKYQIFWHCLQIYKLKK